MFYFFWPQDYWDLSSTTRDWSHRPCIGRWSLNWTVKEVLWFSFEVADPWPHELWVRHTPHRRVDFCVWIPAWERARDMCLLCSGSYSWAFPLHTPSPSKKPALPAFVGFFLQQVWYSDLKERIFQFSSIQSPVVSNSFWPHGLQHARLLCPSPTPRACSNSCPSSQWCHPTISSSVVPSSSCLQFFPASGSFLMSFSSLYQVAKILELQLQHQFFQWIFRTDFL